MIITIVIHIGLAFVLFLIQNWIGERSYSKGYIRFSLLDDRDEALSMNFAIKVFGPIVFLILVVAALQYIEAKWVIENIIHVIYYYLGIRLFLIFLFERGLIVNWPRIIFHYLAIIAVSNIVYYNFISSVETLLPDFSEIKNEIWLLIIVFIYQLGNGFQETAPTNSIQETEHAFLPELKRRKKRYILRKYIEFQEKYGAHINDITPKDSSLRLTIYSILIFENFNRPRIIRWMERIWCKLTKQQVSQGIMQTNSSQPLSDKTSIEHGVDTLMKKYNQVKKEDYHYALYRRIIKQHNPDRKYVRQVLFMSKAIVDSNDNKEQYKPLFSEIKSEFGLYDYFD